MDDTTALSLRVDDIVENLKSIESHLRGEGFVIADKMFLSALDTEAWAAIHFCRLVIIFHTAEWV